MGKVDYKAIYEKNKHDWYAMTEEPEKYEALLAGHYSESNHFVYELLQNAEDAGASRVVVEYHHDRLVFYHDGKPFDEADVRGVSSMLMGTKDRNDASTIGRFGMGFKSVFKYTYQPEIYSDEEAFIIKNYLLPKKAEMWWDYKKEKERLRYPSEDGDIYPFVRCEHLTKIVIPFKKINKKGILSAVSGTDVLEKLKSLSGEILLFLTRIQDLYWINEENGQYSHITVSQDPEDQALVTCRISGNNGDRGVVISRYLKYKQVFDHPEMKNAEVSVAYRVNNQVKNVNELDKSPVWVYFPTRDFTDLPFLIHGSFETAVSREKLMTPSAFNDAFFDRLGTLIAESMEDLARRGLVTQFFIRRVVLAAFQDEKDNDTIPGLTEKITAAFRSKPLVPDASGKSRMAEELRIPVPFSLTEQADSVLWLDVFDGVGDFVALNSEREARFTEYYSWLRDDLDIPVFNFKDWAERLCGQPERTVSTTDGTLDELMAFYDFISDYQTVYHRNEKTSARAGAYENAIRECLPQAWEYLKKAPIVLNAENRMIPAYKEGVLQVYLSSSSKYRRILNSSIVSSLIARKYKSLLEDSLEIGEFDNYQFVKEKVIKKYIEGVDGAIGFENPNDFDEEYIEDLNQIFSLFEETGDADEIRSMLKNADVIKVVSRDGSDLFAKPGETYVDVSDEGIDLAVYFHPIPIMAEEQIEDEDEIYWEYVDTGRTNDFGLYRIDAGYYREHGIQIDKLKKLGLITSPVAEGARCGRGIGDGYWDAQGEFCPDISVFCLEENMEYISLHDDTELARKKSAEILKLLLLISKKLKGTVKRRKINPYTTEDRACLLSDLDLFNWLFDRNGELHIPQELSRYDLDESIYDGLPFNKQAYKVLGFIEKESDAKFETFEKVQALDKSDKKIVFRQLARELGYDVNSIRKTGLGDGESGDEEPGDDVFGSGGESEAGGESSIFDPTTWVSDEFPQHRVRDRENLLAHVQQEFFFADPVKYAKVMRQIRTSKSQKAVRAYTTSMYRNESGANICQMCMKPSSHVEAIEIANLGIEMPQLHLSLCPNCARRYKDLRDASKGSFGISMKIAIRGIDVETEADNYEIKLSDDAVIHFTQTHIAEIKKIVDLLDRYGVPGERRDDIEIVARRLSDDGREDEEYEEDDDPGIDDSDEDEDSVEDPSDEDISDMERSSQDKAESSKSRGGAGPNLGIKAGDLVSSAAFGQGTVVKVDAILNHIDVRFGSGEVKSFGIPMCFEKGYLKLL